jgi:hypothetical protein
VPVLLRKSLVLPLPQAMRISCWIFCSLNPHMPYRLANLAW